MYLIAAKLTRLLFWAALATGILGLLMPDLVPHQRGLFPQT